MKFIVRYLGFQSYVFTLNAMKSFTQLRNSYTIDEIWFVQHNHIFTKGKFSKNKFSFFLNLIPIFINDRGGDITYHGPGQQLMYFLIDLVRLNISLDFFVFLLEKIVISLLYYFNIKSHTSFDAPGIYVGFKKICSIGLRISKGCSMYGIALNVSLNLIPFSFINTCGYSNLCITQISDFVPGFICFNYICSILINEFFRFF